MARDDAGPEQQMAESLQSWVDEAIAGDLAGVALAGISADGTLVTEWMGVVSDDALMEAIQCLVERLRAGE